MHGRPWVREWGPRRASGRGPIAAAEIPLCDAAMVAAFLPRLAQFRRCRRMHAFLWNQNFMYRIAHGAGPAVCRVRRAHGAALRPRERGKGTYRRRISVSVRCCIANRF